ncbi:MAG: thiol:disulfide interchange protein DsbG [Pseudomonadota bacterium]
MSAKTTRVHWFATGFLLLLALAVPAHAQQQAQDPEAIWQTLEESHWVQDGADDADRIIYTFTDPNCPYCDKFREQAAPWIDAGRVQLRHIMVGIIKRSSTPKAATILGSDNPEATLTENRKAYENGGIEPDKAIVKETEGQVRENNFLMRDLGARATPTTIYWNGNDELAAKQGAPRPQEMPDIMGSPKPE